jgi:hypothetical protein
MDKLTTLLFCIQCTDRDSMTIGSFVYNEQKPFRAISPVFENCIGVFQWMRDHNYRTGQLSDMAVYTDYTQEELETFGR